MMIPDQIPFLSSVVNITSRLHNSLVQTVPSPPINIRHTSTLLTSFLALTSTLATPTPTCIPTAPTESPFTVLASHSGSPLHLQPINAHDTQFFIGEATTSYCPASPGRSCPSGLVTEFFNGHGGLQLAVDVPAGQQVYIDPAGALRFLPAHSGNMPVGSTELGFTKTEGPGNGILGRAGGFFACPIHPGCAAHGPWKVYVGVAGFTQTGCMTFVALTLNATAPGAFQYV